MKKLALGVVTIIMISCILPSCNQSKSLQELLNEEKKAIDRFIAMNNFVILKNYPADGVFKDNEFYKSNEGLFYHVVDSGNGNRVQLANDVSARFEYFQYIENFVSGDTTKYNAYNSPVWYSPYQPFSFVYGVTQTYQQSYFVCQGWVIPLANVGENAIIDMIVPSTLGSSTDYSNVTPVFYKNLRYTRFN